MFVAVADLRDTGGHDGWPWEWSEDPVATQALRLYRDGRLLASAQEPFLQAAVPAASARYRLERDLDMDGLTRLANVSRTRWWFDSEAPAGQDAVGLPPLLGVDYQAAPLGGRNGAVAGQPVTVDLTWPGRRAPSRARWWPRTCGSRPTTAAAGACCGWARSAPAATGR